MNQEISADPTLIEEKIISPEEVIETVKDRLEYYSLMNDIFFTAFMQNNKDCMETTLQAFTDDKSIRVTDVKTQFVSMNLTSGRGIRCDSLVTTANGTIYNLEVENRPEGALELRLRYYSSILDKDNIRAGESYKELPPMVNIVVMPKDLRGQGKPRYFVRRVFTESMTEIGDSPEIFEDKTAYIYINAKYERCDSLIGKVIHDFVTDIGSEKYVEVFKKAIEKLLAVERSRRDMAEMVTNYAFKANDVRHLLSDSERAESRAKGKAEGRAEGRAEGHAEGVAEGKAELMQQLYESGLLSKKSIEKFVKKNMMDDFQLKETGPIRA